MNEPNATTAQPLRVVVVGASGRLGTHACELLSATTGFEVVERLGRGECSTARLETCGAVLGLDLTAAGEGALHGQKMLNCGVRPVIGTSGVSLEQNAELDALALELGLGGLVVPNFSLGMWLLQRAAVEAARHLPGVEIVESHHLGKLDAPSGTAKDTAERMAAVRDTGGAAEIPIHSLRLPGVLANQDVVLSGPGEILRISHETYGLDVYSRGILAALRYASRARGMGRGMDAAFGLEQNPQASADSGHPGA